MRARVQIMKLSVLNLLLLLLIRMEASEQEDKLKEDLERVLGRVGLLHLVEKFVSEKVSKPKIIAPVLLLVSVYVYLMVQKTQLFNIKL